MTLARFLRDYVFIPLARRQPLRPVAAPRRDDRYHGDGGLWHGAGWNFVIWGTLQGVAIVVATAVGPRTCPARRRSSAGR